MKVSAENPFTVLCPDLPESVTLAIISASYRNKEEPKSEVKDVVNRVRQRCNNEKSCSFKVDDEILKTTPCESCPKELEVTYTCSDQECKLPKTLQKIFIRRFLDGSHIWS